MSYQSLGPLRHFWRKHFGVLPEEDSINDMSNWFETPLGEALLTEEGESIEQALQCLFGYHLLQMSVSPRLDLGQTSRISHRFALNPMTGDTPNSRLSALADFTDLPLPEESIDVVLLHHVLDYSQSPHQLLRESARVLIPRGHLVIVGFNPWSVLGTCRWFARFFSRKPRWRHQSLRLGRVLDWLTLLDFEAVDIHQGFYRLPLQHPGAIKHLHWLERWGKRLRLPWGGYYLIVARKERIALTPLKPAWRTLRPVPGLGITKLHGRVKSPSIKVAKINPKNRAE